VNALTASAAIASGRVQLANVRQSALLTAKKRALFILLAFVFLTATALMRVVQIGLFEGSPDRRSMADALVPERGEITDRNGVALARAFPSYSLWYNPKAGEKGGSRWSRRPKKCARWSRSFPMRIMTISSAA
jgi:cell division protein FtsI (penicillin-binding protein 3)